MNAKKWLFVFALVFAADALSACPYCRADPEGDDSTGPPISRSTNTFRVSGSHRYAVIINGDTSALHRANVKLFHDTLLKQGYASRDIYILNTERRGYSTGYNDRATLASVNRLFGLLAAKLTGKDTLTIYVTGHGTRIRSKNESAIVLESHAYLGGRALRALVDRLRFRQLVFVTECCYSGGLVDALVRNNTGNVIAISPTDSRHTTYCRFFIRAFCESFEKPETDLNKDGRISVFEAYTYAIGVHKRKLTGRESETNGQYKSCGERRDVVIGNKLPDKTPDDNSGDNPGNEPDGNRGDDRSGGDDQDE